MMKSLVVSALAAALFIASCSDKQNPIEYRPNSGESTVNGSVEGVMTASKSPYYAAGTIVVDSGKVLTIEAGTVVLFADTAAFVVKGQLRIEGTPDENVRLTSSKATWRGIVISNAQPGSVIRSTLIEYIDATTPRDSARNGAVEIYHSDLTLRNCVIRSCKAANGGGVYIENARCVVANNIITGNLATNFGGAICSNNSRSRYLNNTICYNASWNYGGGIVIASPVSDEAQNNILYANTGRTAGSQLAFYEGDSAHALVRYNFLGSSSLDPKFADLVQYRLAPGSPCIDAGSPDAEFLDPDGSRNDQGAYGGPYSLPPMALQSRTSSER